MRKELEKSVYADMDEEFRIKALDTHCEKVEVKPYSKPLSDEEKEGLHEKISASLEEINVLKEEIKELNARKKKLSDLIQDANHDVVRGFTEQRDHVWTVFDAESSFMQEINRDGLIIAKQKMRSAMTVNMFNNIKDGTND